MVLMGNILTPAFLGDLKTPWSAGLAIHWIIGLFIFSLYVPLLFLHLAFGLNPTDMTITFFVDGLEAVSPLFTNTVSYWLLASYFSSVITPITFASANSSAMSCVTVDVVWAILATTGLIFARAIVALIQSVALLLQRPKPESFKRCLTQQRPTHQDEKWSPGNSPHLLYE